MLNQHKILRVLQLITYLQESPHKTINQLASFLDSTERTVYRYLDLLRECGFDLHKDHNQRYYIEQQATDGVYFTPEEAQQVNPPSIFLTALYEPLLENHTVGLNSK